MGFSLGLSQAHAAQGVLKKVVHVRGVVRLGPGRLLQRSWLLPQVVSANQFGRRASIAHRHQANKGLRRLVGALAQKNVLSPVCLGRWRDFGSEGFF